MAMPGLTSRAQLRSAVAWDRTLAPQVRAADITLPGGTMTFGQALKLRPGMSDETPTQYLKYLSEVASVRTYVEGLYASGTGFPPSSRPGRTRARQVTSRPWPGCIRLRASWISF